MKSMTPKSNNDIRASGCLCAPNDPPKIINQSDDLLLNEGDMAYFFIEATGYNLTYKWYLNGAEIVNLGELGSELKVYNVDSGYDGVYKVIVKNEFGEDFREFNLKVNPKNPSIEPTPSPVPLPIPIFPKEPIIPPPYPIDPTDPIYPIDPVEPTI